MKRMRIIRVAKLLLAFSALFVAVLLIAPAIQETPLIAAPGKGANWPQWRGANGSGVSDESDLPVEWSPGKNVRWKTPIPGQGHSSPVVWGDKLFLTTDIVGEVVLGAKAVIHYDGGKVFKHPDSIGSDRKHTFKVFCVDRKSGKLLWERTAYEGTVYDDRHRKGSYASPTPATDGKLVYAWFGSEGLYCYDFKGKEVWKRSLGPIATVGMGPGASPVLFDNSIVVLCDEDNGDKSFIAALDKRTGKEIWKMPRKVQASWATPLLVNAPARTELICSGNEWIISYDPRDGKELWRAKGLDSNAIPSPLAGNGVAFVYAGFPVKKTFAIKLGGAGDLTGTTNILWQYDKGTAYVPSGILYGDYFYLTSDRGILTCLDARTGAMQYENGRVPIPATFTASPVAYSGKILLTSEDGDTFVIKAGPKYEILGTNSVGEPVYASPAISQGAIFIRGEKNLYCISTSGK
jgi:outer membrane protein assembly factor BamB